MATNKPKDFRVFENSEGWVLDFNGEWYPFEFADAAIEMAITLANAASMRGKQSRVLVKTASRGWRERWVSWKDRHPRGYMSAVAYFEQTMLSPP